MSTSGPRYRLVRPAPRAVAAPVWDEAQRRIVEHTGGPLLVLAGPGTGKTASLVGAAVSRVAAGVPVEQLLMLTFSRRAAGELRDRVAANLDRIVREPVARTLHSYAFGVLRIAAVRAGRSAPRLLSGPEQDIEIRRLLPDSATDWPDWVRPALSTRAFADELRDLMMRAVERGVSGPQLAELGRRRKRADWVAVGAFLDEYHGVTVLKDPNAYDPAELIRAAIGVLRDEPELLRAERAVRRRIFVDEFQDTDPAQLELLELIADGADELILVGDPDQSIYAFRGVENTAMRDAAARFGSHGEIDTVALTVSRRTGGELLTATRRIAALLPGPAAQRALTPAEGCDDGTVEVHLFRSVNEEAAFVAGTLRRAQLGGMPWSRMAVIVRSTTTVLSALRRALTSAGVPVAVRGDDLPLAEQVPVRMILDVLDAALRPQLIDDDGAERLLLGPIGGGDVVYLRRLRRALRERFGAGDASLAAAVQDEPGAQLLPEHVRWPVLRVARVLAAGRAALDAQSSPEDVLWAIWSATGLAKRWEGASRAGGAGGAAADRDLDAVVALFDAAARFTDRLPQAPVARFVEHLAAQQIPGDGMSPRAAQADAVAVLTAHASKGLEWDLVCVANVQEGSWPDLRRRGTLLGAEELVDVLAGREPSTLSPVLPQLAEERRLFYVAATRARQSLVVSAVLGDEEQPSRFLDEIVPTDVDRAISEPVRGMHLHGLVAELRATACSPAAADDERRAAAAQLARLAEAGIRGAHPDSWWGILPLSDERPIVDPDQPVPISPSGIESFLQCEVRALLSDLGVRKPNAVRAVLGTVIHEIAKEASAGASAAELDRMLDERWASLDFGARWFAEHERERARGTIAKLAAWLTASRSWLELVAAEEGFGVQVGDARISGRVDRLERDADGRLVIVDLKTGSRKPKDDELATNPQLGAYQLAVERGAFAEHGDRAGGAMLVQLASGVRLVEQRQGPLGEAADPNWIGDVIGEVATRRRGTEFTATLQPQRECQRCDARACCPIWPDGRQVTA